MSIGYDSEAGIIFLKCVKIAIKKIYATADVAKQRMYIMVESMTLIQYLKPKNLIFEGLSSWQTFSLSQ
jgi:hypothetical protein